MLAVCTIAVGLAVAAVACKDDPPTIPDPVVTQPVVPAPVSPAPTPVEVTPSPSPDSELPIWVSCNRVTGICTFGTSDGGTYKVYAKCTKPAGNAAVHGEWRGDVVDGDKVDVRDVCNKIEPFDCKPRTVPVQIDFQAKHRHIGHLGPLYQLKFPQRLSPEECEECVEWEEPKVSTECAEWNECHTHPSATHQTPFVSETCWQERLCVDAIEWNCKDPETREYEEAQPCECECVPEWSEWELISTEYTEWSACEPVVSFSIGNHRSCQQTRLRTETYQRVEKCTQETETKTEEETETQPCDCPPECVIPPAGTTLSWSGPANCEAECSAFGPYECGTPADFWICKAGNDRIVEHTFPGGDLCRNGKERSHTRSCVCVEED
jgi:hypothetical protein